MTYDNLIDIINIECRKRNISVYRLSKISSIPISTLYGVLNKNNKAQMDTLCEILNALGLQLVVRPIGADEKGVFRFSENQNDDTGLSEEKQEILEKLVEWLRD